ncbi:thiamine pyrophosphate-binding protein [Bacillus sp. JJ634]
MLGRDFFLKALKEYEVEYLFGNPGTTELPLIDGLVNYPDIEFIVSLHEDVCVGMAAGYAQATGKPGVVNLHAAPGLAHGMGNVYDAYRAGVPLIVTAGQQDTRLAIQEPALWGEMVSMVKDYTKWSWEVKNAQELPTVLHRAFKMALTEPMGPVFLSLPSDVLWQEVDAEPIPLTVVSSNTRGDLEAVQNAAILIRQAKNPVFLVGDQLASCEGLNEMVQLAEMIGAPVYVEHQCSRLNFPYGHPQYAGRCLPNGPYIEKVLKDADVVVFVGVTSQAPLLYFDRPIIQPGTKVIAINSGEWELGKNMHVDTAILANPRIAVKEITELIDLHASNEDRARFESLKEKTLLMKKQSDEQRLKELEGARGQVPLSPAEVVYELNKALPENVLVVDESVTSGRFTHSYLELNQPGSLIALKGGGLGYGMPASLGAQLGRPDQRVVNVIGDGSSLYYIQSLWNAAKHNLPVVFVIMNNQSYMILKGGILNIDGESAKQNVFPGMDLNEPAVDFVSVAKGFGIDSIRIEKPEELQPAFGKAFNEKKPILLDVLIDSTVRVFLK